jgi:hypothetical protein
VTRPGRTFTAYQGAVAAPGTDPRPFKRDAGRAIERLLLETGRAHLNPDEIAAAEQALQEWP